ncbi:MAG: hypothetical protein ACKVQB_13200, partial [Bacteroidia bacterium]
MREFLILFSVLSVISCTQPETETLSVPPEKLTFTEHIAPIIYKNCVVCHRNDGIAPFSLVTYKDVWRKKKTIVNVTQRGFMPPWPADPNYSHFVGERILSKEEKLMLKLWVKYGAKEGPASALPMVPKFPNGSLLGTPDLTLYLDSVLLEAHGQDRFLTVKIPFSIGKDTFVRAVEFVPGNGNNVHHMNGHLLNYSPLKKANVFDGSRMADEQANDFEDQVLK